MSTDEMMFLIEKFYDSEQNVFRNTAGIEISDGRGQGSKITMLFIVLLMSVNGINLHIIYNHGHINF